MGGSSRAHPQSGVDLTYIKQTGEANGDGGDQYTGLDRFGRVVDQRWLKTSNSTHTDRFKYGYDRNSNAMYRTNEVNHNFDELYHASGPGYGYDNLNQLSGFLRGVLSASGGPGTPLDTVASPSTTESWNYDAHGQSSSSSDSGVWGENDGGGFGVSGSTDSVQAAGVWGDNPSGDGVRGTSGGDNFAGISGSTSHPRGLGVFGTNFNKSAHGTLGGFIADGGPAVGVFGSVPQGGYSGFFAGPGNVHVVGILEKSAGSFKIDHPLEPANKYLCHSFVESPDMKNTYDGVAGLDGHGEAVVELPLWFEILNEHFRYQLTAIGGPAREGHHSRPDTFICFVGVRHTRPCQSS